MKQSASLPLSTRLTGLSEQNKQTGQLIHRLAKLQFQPGEDGDVRGELSTEIHESLKLQDEELELLGEEVDEFAAGSALSSRVSVDESGREKDRLTIQVARLREDLKQVRSEFRKAQLQAKRNAEAAKHKERELLFADIETGSTPFTAGRRRGATDRLTQDEIAANASGDVTAALRRTHQLMTAELTRSRFAQEALDQSTAALAELGEKYTDLGTLLAHSKTLVTSLLRSQKSDTWYLETTLYILVATICWLLFRRLLYGPLWWFAWLPLKLVYNCLLSVPAAVGIAGSAASTQALSSQSTPVPSPSLIIQPSAGSRVQSRMTDQASSGGAGAKREDPGSSSQQAGQMREEASKQLQDNASRRGDGQPLIESDQPRNPKKRMWDENVERAKYEAQQQQQQQSQRDEL